MIRFWALVFAIFISCSLIVRDYTFFLMLADQTIMLFLPVEEEETKNQAQKETETKIIHTIQCWWYDAVVSKELLSYIIRQNPAPFFKVISPPPEMA
jgi:hypothetical protein